MFRRLKQVHLDLCEEVCPFVVWCLWFMIPVVIAALVKNFLDG